MSLKRTNPAKNLKSARGRKPAPLAWRLLALLAIATAVGCAKEPAVTKKAEMTPEEKIARGRIVSYASGCHDCHTPGGLYGAPDSTRMLSGSELGWEGPWGISFPRNLTPDMGTGIGSWSEEQIVTAFRTGIRPDKTSLLPPMPWPTLSHMSDEDAYALAAFLKSLPPITHKAPDRVAPGTVSKAVRLTFPPPPAWDARNLPKPQ
jgi:mono/diheme cytochrome c family protein